MRVGGDKCGVVVGYGRTQKKCTKIFLNGPNWSLVVFGRDNSQNTCMLGEVRMDMDGLE